MRIIDILQELRTGPGQFRFIVQPIVAMLLALRDGRKDAQLGAPPYLDSIIRGERSAARLRQGFGEIAKPFVVAFIMDAVIQIIFLHLWRPVASLCVALLLIALPYSIVRGLANRGARQIGRMRHA